MCMCVCVYVCVCGRSFGLPSAGSAGRGARHSRLLPAAAVGRSGRRYGLIVLQIVSGRVVVIGGLIGRGGRCGGGAAIRAIGLWRRRRWWRLAVGDWRWSVHAAAWAWWRGRGRCRWWRRWRRSRLVAARSDRSARVRGDRGWWRHRLPVGDVAAAVSSVTVAVGVRRGRRGARVVHGGALVPAELLDACAVVRRSLDTTV